MSDHENSFSPPTRLHSFAPPTGLRWLYVDFNSYFASVEQQTIPALRGKPVAVVPVATDATCAIAASYEAKAFGIKTGTPIYEAKKMCPSLVCVLANHEKYVEYHDRIVDEIDRHTPVDAVCSIDEVACRLMKNETSVEKSIKLAQAIKAGVRQNIGEYIKCSIGIAPNRYLAKIATDMKKPDGLTVLEPHDLPHRLFDLELRDLPGIGVNMEKRVNSAGIYDMKSLFDYPPKHLRAIWGNLWGEKMWYLLRGYDLPQEKTERSSVGHSHVLAPEHRPIYEAQKIAMRLTQKASARLRRIGYYAENFSVSVRIENGPRLSTEIRTRAVQDSVAFMQMLDDLWSRIIQEAGSKVRIKKISVTLSGLVEQKNVQADLFDFADTGTVTKRVKNEKISKAMDDLNRKFGKDTVLMGMTEGQGKAFTGTKIAFTRIPDVEEFWE